jgi:L-asparagine transporter-like permease
VKLTFSTLVAISFLPWVYIGTESIFDFGDHMAGFSSLPFFALFFVKEMVLRSPAENQKQRLRSYPYWKNALVLLVAVLLTVIVVVVAEWVDTANQGVIAGVFALFVVSMITLDVRRARRRIRNG